MNKLPTQKGALDELIDDLLTSLAGERVDEKVLKDVIWQAIRRDFHSRGDNRFKFDWRGKAEILKTIQRPSRGALHSDEDRSRNFGGARHVAIEGECLEVMKLIERAYFGKIKMIYMNPPFNIGGELIVRDGNDILERYLDYSKNVDESGKIGVAAGAGHSDWLNGIFARLFVARNLLSSDGVIFVSIDDHEAHHLRILMDEIFGSENFVASFVWEKRYSPPPDATNVGYVHENIICYRKSDDFTAGLLPMTDDQSSRYTNPDNDTRGPWKAADYTCRYTSDERPTLYYPVQNPNTGQEIFPKRTRVWACSRAEHEKNVEEGRIWWGVDGTNSIPAKKKYLFEIRQGAMPKSILQHDEVGHTDEATKELRSHLPGLKLPSKPTRLMKHLLSIANVGPRDFVLDCYAGTGALGEAIFSLQSESVLTPSFILIEFPERLEDHSSTLTEAMFTRLGSSLKKYQLPNEGFRAFRLGRSNFKVWEGQVEGERDLLDMIENHVENLNQEFDPQGLLYEIILRAGFTLETPVSSVEVSGKNVFSVADGNLLVCLEKEISNTLIEGIAALNPLQVVLLDVGFQNSDELKTNAIQIFRARRQVEGSEISLRTV